MNATDLDRVFGRGRLRMVTGDHVEVFREEALPGERRRYTKRFLATPDGDFREWTEREWRILARLVGHGIASVPDVVQFDRGAGGRTALVQTYDAGITVDHWATLLPVERDGTVRRSAFDDCAHWWALAKHCLVALDAIHALDVVHLDLKADNVCIPASPAVIAPRAAAVAALFPRFDQLALIDFAFALVSGEPLLSALPIARQPDYEYQSPRLLEALEAGSRGNLMPTQRLDWRCDVFSLAAMLRRYLPDPEGTLEAGWTAARHAEARAFVRRLLEAHDAERPALRPHAAWIARASAVLGEADLAASLHRGWRLAATGTQEVPDTPTPVTRIARPVAPTVVPLASTVFTPAMVLHDGRDESAFAQAIFASERSAPYVVTSDDVDRAHAATDPADPQVPTTRKDAHDELMPPPAVASRRRRAVAWGAALAAGTALAVPAVEHAWQAFERNRVPAVDVASAGAKALPPNAVRIAPRHEPGSVVTAPAAAPPTVVALDDAHDKAAVATPADEAPAASRSMEAAPAAPTGAPSQEPAAAARTATASTETGVGTRPAAPSEPADRKSRSIAAKATSPGIAAAGQRQALATSKPESLRGKPVPTARPAAIGGALPPTRVAIAPRGHAAPQPAPHARNAPVEVAAARAPAPSRHAQVPNGGALLPKAPVEAVAQAPAAGTSPLPPRILALLAATPSDATTSTTGEGAVKPVPATATAQPAAARATSQAPVTIPTPEGAAPVPQAFPAAPQLAMATPSVGAPAESRVAVPRDWSARAADVMSTQVPRVAQRTDRLVRRVLFVAGHAESPAQAEEVRAAAGAVSTGPETLPGFEVAGAEARAFHEAARAAWGRGSVVDALDLQTKAFGANPTDAEIAGNLAFLQLRQRNANAAVARDLALHALSLHDARHPLGRIEDWTTLAVANALAGREREARDAWLASLALAPVPERQCRAALNAYAAWGERLRGSVEAMLYRARQWGLADRSALCEWPPHWLASR